MHGLLSCEICFFVYCVITRVADHAPRLPLSASAIVVTESDISKKFMLRFLQVSCSSNESVVQQERRNCIVSSICLSVRFDWRNFALALVAPLQRFLYNFRLDYDW